MERREIEILARRLMNKHGLYRWSFGWCDHKTTVGWCYHGRRRIEFSTYFTEISDFDIEQTILHEIAHALVSSDHGHDAVWRAKAREIGYFGKRCLDTDVVPEGKYIGICPAGHEIYRHRKTEAVITEQFYCPKCPKSLSIGERRFVFYLTSDYRSMGTSAEPVSGIRNWLLFRGVPVVEQVTIVRPPATLQAAEKVVSSVPEAKSHKRDYDEGTAFIDWD